MMVKNKEYLCVIVWDKNPKKYLETCSPVVWTENFYKAKKLPTKVADAVINLLSNKSQVKKMSV